MSSKRRCECGAVHVFDEWPLVCKLCGWRYDHDEDPGTPPLANRRGLGDVVSRVLGKLGILKRKGCNCSKRQAWLNSFRPR